MLEGLGEEKTLRGNGDKARGLGLGGLSSGIKGGELMAGWERRVEVGVWGVWLKELGSMRGEGVDQLWGGSLKQTYQHGGGGHKNGEKGEMGAVGTWNHS